MEDCAQLLVSAGPLFDDITAVVYARVPIVKGTVTVPLYDADTRIDFDISVNNTLGLHNTDLLRTYAQLDSRCVDAFVVTHTHINIQTNLVCAECVPWCSLSSSGRSGEGSTPHRMARSAATVCASHHFGSFLSEGCAQGML